MMSPRIFPAIFVALTVFSADARAAWSFGEGVENYSWQEFLEGSSLSPKESGQRLALQWRFIQEGDAGLLASYHGKYYLGSVRYETFSVIDGAPASTTTEYSGDIHEGLLSYRTNAASYKLDYTGGLGIDSWKRRVRHTGFDYVENYRVLFLRGGINFDQPALSPGFHGGGGIKYPLYTRVDAHFDDIGFNSNPTFKPGKQASFYLELGYRTKYRLDIVGYYDSWRFKKANPVTVSNSLGTWVFDQPQAQMDAMGIRIMYLFDAAE